MNKFTSFLKHHSLASGLVLMFVFTWAIDLSNSGLLPFHVPFAVGLFAGWVFIFVSLLMTGVTQGKEAVVVLLKRFLIWRVSWKWYLVALLLLPGMQFSSILLTTAILKAPPDLSSVMAYKIFSPSSNLLLLIIPWFLYEIITNGEEMGWRGYVLPRLQTRYNALVSSLIVGLLWGAWHLPKFLGTGANAGRSLGWFVMAHVALAVLYTWLYTNTRGSLLIVTLFHASGNTSGIFMPISFAAQGGIVLNIMIVLYILAAACVTLFAGPARLSLVERKDGRKDLEVLEGAAD